MASQRGHTDVVELLIQAGADVNLATTDAVCIQWNLRIKDKLVHRPMSAIRRLSFIGEFLPKILHFTFLSAVYPIFYIL